MYVWMNKDESNAMNVIEKWGKCERMNMDGYLSAGFLNGNP